MMRETKFKKYSDAESAGYAHCRFSYRVGNVRLWNRDVSGGNSFGYRYACEIQRYNPDLFGGCWETVDVEPVTSVTIHFTHEMNAGKQLGCLTTMYHGDDLERLKNHPLFAQARKRERRRAFIDMVRRRRQYRNVSDIETRNWLTRYGRHGVPEAPQHVLEQKRASGLSWSKFIEQLAA